MSAAELNEDGLSGFEERLPHISLGWMVRGDGGRALTLSQAPCPPQQQSAGEAGEVALLCGRR